MPKKYIILDTETTGLEVRQGHRMIEIGAVVLNDRKKSEEHFHTYLNPSRLIDPEASEVHGIYNKDLEDKPSFDEIAEEFLEFIEGSTLVIHNAAFDVGFLNNELKLASSTYPMLEEICEIEDSLMIARDKFPGQRNSLDALANRFEVSGYDRTFHGALLDANILADVYIFLTGGQSKFEFMSANGSQSKKEELSHSTLNADDYALSAIKANDNDLKEVTIGEHGAFHNVKEGAIFIDNTTASAKIARELNEEAKKRKFGFLDAPVSGGQAGAENGALTVMIGGEQNHFEQAESIIDCYSKKMKLLGNSGSGQLAKMVNQICIAGFCLLYTSPSPRDS